MSGRSFERSFARGGKTRRARFSRREEGSRATRGDSQRARAPAIPLDILETFRLRTRRAACLLRVSACPARCHTASPLRARPISASTSRRVVVVRVRRRRRDAPASFRRRRPAASFERRASRAPPLRRARRYRARLTAASSSRPPREGRRRVDRVAAPRALSPAAVARDASARGIRDSAGVREAVQVRGEEPEEHRRPRGPAALLPSSQEGARGLEHASPRRDARRARPPQLVARERRKKPRRRHSSRSRRSLSLASAIERSPSRDATTTHARR